MFIMDIPYVPMQKTPIVLAQVAASVPHTQPDYILKDCLETEHATDAFSTVSPAGMLYYYFKNHGRTIESSSIKITLQEDTTHGKLNAKTSSLGAVYYIYNPEPRYVGNDNAVFMAEYEGKRYKIVVDLHVFIMVDEKAPSSCSPPKLIKVNGKPAL